MTGAAMSSLARKIAVALVLTFAAVSAAGCTPISGTETV